MLSSFCGLKMPCKDKPHTPIVSERQKGLFGAELARKRAGKKGKTEMSEAELSRHLKESKGKNLPTSSDIKSYARRHGKKRTR